MPDPIIPPAAENTNQAAPEAPKPDGQAPAAPVVEPPKADPAPAAAPAPDSSSTPAPEAPKPDDKNPPAAQAVVFELKKADGSQLSAAEAEKIVSFSKEHGLSPAQAQALYNRENAALTAFDAEVARQYEERKSSWIETVKKDPIMGGEHHAQNIQAAHLELQKYATPEFTKLLDETGFGNHPELLRVFYNIHLANKDDVAVRAGDPPAALKETKDVMYGETKK